MTSWLRVHALHAPFLVLLVLSTLLIAPPGRFSAGLFEAGIFTLAIVVLLNHALHASPVPVPWPFWLVAAMPVLGVAQLALGWTVHPYATKTATLQWAAYFATLLVSWRVFSESRARDRFLSALTLFGGVTALYVLLQPAMGPLHLWGWIDAANSQMAGPFQNRNTYAAFVQLLLPVAGWRALRDRDNAWAWWGLVAILAASVVAVEARAGSVLIFLEVASLLVLGWMRKAASVKTLALAAAQVVVMAACWLAVVGTGGLAKRLQAADPMQYRTEIYTSTLNMIAERPVLGWGLGAFQDAYPRFALFDVAKVVNFAHSDWLQWAAEGGLPAALALFLWIGWLIPRMIRQPWALGLLFVFLHAIVDYPMQRAGMAGWVFAMAGAVCAADFAKRKRIGPASRKVRSAGSETDIAEPGAGEAVGIEPVAAVQQHRGTH